MRILWDHLIAKCLKPPKDGENKNGKKDKEKGNSAKDNSDDEDDLKVYASMARMWNDDVSKSKDYGDSSQLTNWILDSGATCHMTPEVKDLIPGTLEDTDKYIKVATKFSPLSSKNLYAYGTFLFCGDVVSVRNFNVFIRVF